MERQNKRLRERLREQQKRIRELEQENAVLRDEIERNQIRILTRENALKEAENRMIEVQKVYKESVLEVNREKEQFQKLCSEFTELRGKYKRQMESELKRVRRQA